MIKKEVQELVDKYVTSKTKKAAGAKIDLVDALVELFEDRLRIEVIENEYSSVCATDAVDYGTAIVHVGPDGEARKIELAGHCWEPTTIVVLDNKNVCDHRA